jgi:hypothetical protein
MNFLKKLTRCPQRSSDSATDDDPGTDELSKGLMRRPSASLVAAR